MELDGTQRHGCKFWRIGENGVRRINSSSRLGNGRKVEEVMNPSEEGEKEPKRLATAAASAIDLTGGGGGFYSWPSSRIVRVSRASGGKDRHSKVLTSKGLRDRRVRLSVNTAIQFYDLQDRLGYDQPSKAVEWLLKAAAGSIHELPPISCVFPGTPKQFTDEKRSSNGGSDEPEFDAAEVVANCGGDSAGGGGGSPSITSECSGLSLSRSVSRIKARDRAKERVAVKQKEKDRNEPSNTASLNTFSQTTSFTELLSVGLNHLINNDQNNTSTSPMGSSNSGGDAANESHFFQKSPRQWSSAPTDYFSNGLLGPQTTSRSGHMFLSSPLSSAPSPLFSLATDHHPEMQPFSFIPDHLASIVHAAAAGNSGSHTNHPIGGGEYNLNFAISSSPNPSGLTGFNRGTLQSNSTSPSVVTHLQRFPPIDGPPSFFLGTTAPMENHPQFLSGFDSRLQLYFGNSRGNDNDRQSDQKEKRNN